MTGLYIPGTSPLHRTPPLAKLLALVLLCSGLFLFDGWTPLLVVGALVAAGFAAARLGPVPAWQALRPSLWVLALLFGVQWVLAGPTLAGFVAARFAVLILAAALVTLTTRTSDFVAGIEAALKPAPTWIPKQRIALAISLCLRFIPVILAVAGEIRQAQQARGLDRSLLALLVPLIVRTLKTADEVAQAIEARSVD